MSLAQRKFQSDVKQRRSRSRSRPDLADEHDSDAGYAAKFDKYSPKKQGYVIWPKIKIYQEGVPGGQDRREKSGALAAVRHYAKKLCQT